MISKRVTQAKAKILFMTLSCTRFVPMPSSFRSCSQTTKNNLDLGFYKFSPLSNNDRKKFYE